MSRRRRRVHALANHQAPLLPGDRLAAEHSLEELREMAKQELGHLSAKALRQVLDKPADVIGHLIAAARGDEAEPARPGHYQVPLPGDELAAKHTRDELVAIARRELAGVMSAKALDDLIARKPADVIGHAIAAARAQGGAESDDQPTPDLTTPEGLADAHTAAQLRTMADELGISANDRRRPKRELAALILERRD